jgi:cytochrome oxidase Cu insertion factor (SCO1/SenC/PrrC family)
MPKKSQSNAGLIVGVIAGVLLLVVAGFIIAAVLVLQKMNTEAVAVGTETKPAPQKPADSNIGKEAPEIEGEDIDGNRFKLSDYRGKVVLLDFWGHW